MNIFGMGDLPPEIAEQISRQQDLAMMSYQDAAHQAQEALDSFTEKQLEMIQRWVHRSQDAHYAGSLEGAIGAVLRLKFGRCGCGTNHDRPEESPIPEQRTTDQTDSDETLFGTVEEQDEARSWDPALLAKYGLVPVGSVRGVPAKRPYLTCSNCSTPVVSLADRMLRPPGVEGCPSCQQQAKWG